MTAWRSQHETLAGVVLGTAEKLLSIQKIAGEYQATYVFLTAPSFSALATKQCYPFLLKCDSLPWMKQYRSEWVITEKKSCLHDLTGHKIWRVFWELFMCLLIHLQLASPITWENGCRKKNKPLLVVVAQSFPMVAIIAFPVQIAQFVGK